MRDSSPTSTSRNSHEWSCTGLPPNRSSGCCRSLSSLTSAKRTTRGQDCWYMRRLCSCYKRKMIFKIFDCQIKWHVRKLGSKAIKSEIQMPIGHCQVSFWFYMTLFLLSAFTLGALIQCARYQRLKFSF
ncbi:unnamed protein product [Vitrella brassicaformis CCMP3155]|uniref:Uncharacterized protein n=1 Tax=Vitrella brassicaformis (strain CCMP3155) TaxID=1169540 RepID=A0A0G4EMW6_VITBC|nr:unnamed protein product [Vitrella brassicaformis CCMP3155]|eukprot:CEL98511.1 unnamed protein product [Vitrella brassicaformis CCMP3155]